VIGIAATSIIEIEVNVLVHGIVLTAQLEGVATSWFRTQDLCRATFPLCVQDFLKQLKLDFAKVIHVKPMASRDGSAELFVLATGFRGN
jgi:hypothetical protein